MMPPMGATDIFHGLTRLAHGVHVLSGIMVETPAPAQSSPDVSRPSNGAGGRISSPGEQGNSYENFL